MITTTATVTQALSSVSTNIALLINLPGSDDMKVTDSVRDITYDGVTYRAHGSVQFTNAGSVDRKSVLTIDAYTINFGQADRTAYDLYKDNSYVGAPASVYIAFLDDDGALLNSTSVLQVYSGQIHSWGLNRDFTVKLSNQWAAFDIQHGRTTSSTSQQEVYPGDTFFEYSYMEELATKWGL